MKLCRFFSWEDPLWVQYGVVDLQQQRIDTGSKSYPLDQVELLTPLQPGKIVCVGVNYVGHRLDGHQLPDQPLIFLKPGSSAAGPDSVIPFPNQSQQVDFEAELGLVIAKPCYQIDQNQVADHILGYCCANDVTARDIQEQEQCHTRAKSFNGFAPFGPWLETEFDPADFTLRCYLNGELRQQAHSSELLFSIPELVSFISQVMPLEAGDLILTGTPQGMGAMQPGDEVVVEISGIGRLSNRLGQPTLDFKRHAQPHANHPHTHSQQQERRYG